MRHTEMQHQKGNEAHKLVVVVGSYLQAPPEVAYDRVIKRIAINSALSGLFLNPPGFFDLRPAHTTC